MALFFPSVHTDVVKFSHPGVRNLEGPVSLGGTEGDVIYTYRGDFGLAKELGDDIASLSHL